MCMSFVRDEVLVDPTDDELDDPVDRLVVVRLLAATPEVTKLMIPSMSGVIPLKLLECVEKGLCLARGG